MTKIEEIMSYVVRELKKIGIDAKKNSGDSTYLTYNFYLSPPKMISRLQGYIPSAHSVCIRIQDDGTHEVAFYQPGGTMWTVDMLYKIVVETGEEKSFTQEEIHEKWKTFRKNWREKHDYEFMA